MSFNKLILLSFFVFFCIKPVEFFKKCSTTKKIESLRELCLRKVWQYRDFFVEINEDNTINWLNIPDCLQIDILRQCPVDKNNVVLVVKNGIRDILGVQEYTKQLLNILNNKSPFFF